MSFISKHIIASNKGKFILFLICIYIAVATAVLPYGIFPSLTISTMAPLLVFLVAYPTHYILLPRFLGNNKKTANKYYFIILSLLLIMAVMTFVWLCLNLLYNVFDIPRGGFSDSYYQMSPLNIAYDEIHLRFLNPSSYILTYIFTCLFYAHNRHHEGMNKMKEENKELEMRILKSQINSHFLHNALNNIYSMIYFGNKDDASKYVMKLSQMLRYVLDDCEADHVPISGEIKYIENFIDFQKSRFETTKNVTFNYVQDYIGEVQIPPMIFQPLIENCFKYCPLQNDNSFIHIEIIVKQNQVKYTSENTQPLLKQSSDRNNSGIGIENMKNRLYLNYKDNYSLNILEKDDVYQTELIINLI